MTLTIYQIYCKDENISDCYIGSTTDFCIRKRGHRTDCNNKNRKQHNYKLYRVIRENGGFDNWEFKILNQMEHHPELRKMQEQAYINLIKPTLNTISANFDLEKNKIYHKNYRIEKKEKIRENRNKSKQKIIEYRIKNRDKLLAQMKEYRIKNRDELNARRRELRAKKKAEGLV